MLARLPASSPSRPSERLGKTSSEGGNTGRRADWPCNINFAQKGEIAETVRSAPGRDPRMARFIRILGAKARKSAFDCGPKTVPEANIQGTQCKSDNRHGRSSRSETFFSSAIEVPQLNSEPRSTKARRIAWPSRSAAQTNISHIHCALIHLSDPVSLTDTSDIQRCNGFPSAVPR